MHAFQVECRAGALLLSKPIAKPAAAGIRAHSGWAALVAITCETRALEVLDRRRIVLVDPDVRGASQPYHFAKQLRLKEAETYLERCAEISKRLALKVLQEVAETLREQRCELVGCGILLASGRPVPALVETLASHALIHTAEGEFFRRALREGCEQLGIGVLGIRERELFDRAIADLGVPLPKLKRQLANLGRSLGPPWTQDQKNATLAGWLALASAGKARQK